MPFLRANHVELLIDGADTYDNMIHAIESAECYVLVQFYIVRDDTIGRRLRDALVSRAHNGVRIYFLYDEIGCITLPDNYLDVMREQGIEVSGFKTTRGRSNRFQINFRNHRKLLVVDGRSSFIGGNNLGEEYLVYRDTHLRIDGPAAQHIQLSFLQDWYWATDQLLSLSPKIIPSGESNQAVAIVNTGPADALPGCSILFTTLISQARSRLWISSPYFVPNEAVLEALKLAALRQVDVRVMIPEKPDKKTVWYAAFACR